MTATRVRFSTTMPEGLLEEVDFHLQRTRSEAIRGIKSIKTTVSLAV